MNMVLRDDGLSVWIFKFCGMQDKSADKCGKISCNQITESFAVILNNIKKVESSIYFNIGYNYSLIYFFVSELFFLMNFILVSCFYILLFMLITLILSFFGQVCIYAVLQQVTIIILPEFCKMKN